MLGHATDLCNLFAQLGLQGVTVFVTSGMDGVGAGDASGFPPNFLQPVHGPLITTTQAQVQVTHQIPMFSQVPGSLASAVLQACTPTPRLPRVSPKAASRTTFRARTTRTMRCPTSSTNLATIMRASTNALAAVTRPFLTLYFVQPLESWLP